MDSAIPLDRLFNSVLDVFLFGNIALDSEEPLFQLVLDHLHALLVHISTCNGGSLLVEHADGGFTEARSASSDKNNQARCNLHFNL